MSRGFFLAAWISLIVSSVVHMVAAISGIQVDTRQRAVPEATLSNAVAASLAHNAGVLSQLGSLGNLFLQQQQQQQEQQQQQQEEMEATAASQQPRRGIGYALTRDATAVLEDLRILGGQVSRFLDEAPTASTAQLTHPIASNNQWLSLMQAPVERPWVIASQPQLGLMQAPWPQQRQVQPVLQTLPQMQMQEQLQVPQAQTFRDVNMWSQPQPHMEQPVQPQPQLQAALQPQFDSQPGAMMLQPEQLSQLQFRAQVQGQPSLQVQPGLQAWSQPVSQMQMQASMQAQPDPSQQQQAQQQQVQQQVQQQQAQQQQAQLQQQAHLQQEPQQPAQQQQAQTRLQPQIQLRLQAPWQPWSRLQLQPATQARPEQSQPEARTQAQVQPPAQQLRQVQPQMQMDVPPQSPPVSQQALQPAAPPTEVPSLLQDDPVLSKVFPALQTRQLALSQLEALTQDLKHNPQAAVRTPAPAGLSIAASESAQDIKEDAVTKPLLRRQRS